MTQDAETTVVTAAERGALFYASVIGEAEAREALVVADLAAEIALLRAKLRAHLLEHPDDQTLTLKSVALIVRAVATRYRMSSKHSDDLGASLEHTMQLVGDQFNFGATADE